MPSYRRYASKSQDPPPVSHQIKNNVRLMNITTIPANTWNIFSLAKILISKD